MSSFWVILILLLLALLVLLGRKLGKKGKSYAIPRGKEVYQDLSSGGKILRSLNYGISGKPDMIRRKGRTLIPYEYKSTDARRPREGHIFQMVAYFLILEDLYPNMDVPYGVLKYRNEAFRIENIGRNRELLLGIVEDMRSQRGEPVRNHSNSGRCFKCSFNQLCGQKLISSKS